jgi:hypothetical protein
MTASEASGRAPTPHLTRRNDHQAASNSGASFAEVIHGVTGDDVMKRMAIWTSAIPS